MSKLVEVWLLDFLNLVFGAGPTTQEFWDEVVIPSTASYYTEAQYGDINKATEQALIAIKEFRSYDRRLNALWFALVELLNIKVIKKDNSDDEDEKKLQPLVRQSTFNVAEKAIKQKK